MDEGQLSSEHVALARRLLSTSPWTAAEVPEAFRRRFTTLDGDQTIVYIWSTYNIDSDTDAYLWESELGVLEEQIRRQGIQISLVDERLISAWISRMVLVDTPRVVPLTFAVVFLFLLLDFRSIRRVLVVMAPMAVGMLGFAAGIYLTGLELNLYNVIIVPSVVGIGIDGAVHIIHRYRMEGPGSVVFVMRHTGVAVFLASFTTAIGFGSSLVCSHNGLQSVGSLAILGIGATFLGAVVFFPGLLTLLERTSRRKD